MLRLAAHLLILLQCYVLTTCMIRIVPIALVCVWKVILIFSELIVFILYSMLFDSVNICPQWNLGNHVRDI